jgi:hypothetical protein
LARAAGALKTGIPTQLQSLSQGIPKEVEMKMLNNEKGAIGWILLWAIGIPVPLLLLFFLARGCT